MISTLLKQVYKGDQKAISRVISILVNDPGRYTAELADVTYSDTPVIGITGPPGAGKSTLTDKLIGEMVSNGLRVAVLCIDPSSPFTKGALLGDRIRMSQWHNHDSVFIRSLATRGSLGGLPSTAKQVVQILRAAPYDFIIVETVGVGQSEIEIASISNCTLVVLVPESGDEIQFMKAGLMEIADIFVVNKCDRPGADHFASDIASMLHTTNKKVVKTVATERRGVTQLYNEILQFVKAADN